MDLVNNYMRSYNIKGDLRDQLRSYFIYAKYGEAWACLAQPVVRTLSLILGVGQGAATRRTLPQPS